MINIPWSLRNASARKERKYVFEKEAPVVGAYDGRRDRKYHEHRHSRVHGHLVAPDEIADPLQHKM